MRNLHKKNFKPEIKPTVENLQKELYQLENKQAKGDKVCTNIRQDMEQQKNFQNFLKDTSETEYGESNNI